MTKSAFAAILGLCVAVVAGAGCASQGVNHPFKKYTKEEQLAASAARGYKEIRRDKIIYVVSSHEAAERVKNGEEPAQKMAAIGFGPEGEKVIFEANKDGIEDALMKEFERRHGNESSI